MASVKLGSLLLRTLAKPIANSLKSTARNHEGFRSIFVGTAQWVHRTTIRLQVFVQRDKERYDRNLKRDIAKVREAGKVAGKTEQQIKADEEATKKKHGPRINRLPPEKAIEAGANFVAEGFLFAVAAGATLFEYRRGKRKEDARAREESRRNTAQDATIATLREDISSRKEFEDRIVGALRIEAGNGSKVCTALLQDIRNTPQT